MCSKKIRWMAEQMLGGLRHDIGTLELPFPQERVLSNYRNVYEDGSIKWTPAKRIVYTEWTVVLNYRTKGRWRRTFKE